MPTHGPLPVETALSLAGLTATLARDPDVRECILICEDHFAVIEARDRIARRALGAGAEFMLWIDSDMTFPSDLFRRLYDRGKPAVACNYLRRKRGGGPLAIDFEDKPIPISERGLTVAKATGLGAALIRSDIFERMQRPWFRLDWQISGGDWALASDDGIFWENMRNEAFENLWLDCDTSKRIGHVGTAVYGGGEQA